jgi:hypothetical protein
MAGKDVAMIVESMFSMKRAEATTSGRIRLEETIPANYHIRAARRLKFPQGWLADGILVL